MISLLAQIQAVDTGISFGWLFVKTILAMVVILALIFFLFRYLIPKLQIGLPQKGTRIKILERTGLEPRKFLCLVQVDNQQILLGVSEQGIQKLMEIREA